MRKIAIILILSLCLPAFATTFSFDESFPADAAAAIGVSLERNTEGRGSIDFTASGYSEDTERFPGQIHASFDISYGEKSYTINAVGTERGALLAEIDQEITSMLYYEEMLLSPGPRLDYVYQSSYSMLGDEHYRNGTRFRGIDSNGRIRGIFEVSGRYEGVTVLDPVYLDRPFPGIGLEDDGEWTAFSTFSMGFRFPAIDMVGSFSIGRTDLIFPFIPLISVVYRYLDGESYVYGGIGLEAYANLSRMFPSVEFTLIQEGRIGADASILLGGGPSGFDWKGRFSIFYEHRATSHFYWRIGYENFHGEHMLTLGVGGDF